MSETRFTPPEAYTNPEEKKKELLKQLLSPEIKHFILRTVFAFRVDKNDIEDISQKVTLNAYKAINKGQFTEEQAKLTTWLSKIIRNECINVFRKEKRSPQNNPTAIEISDGEIISTLPTGAEHLEQIEEEEYLQTMLNKLGPKQKEVMELYIQGDTREEITKKLGVPYNTVGTRIHYAKKKLFELIEKQKQKK